MKHHYVPECYLKEFTDLKSKLYSLDLGVVETYNKCSIGEKSPGQICKIENHYSINFDLRSTGLDQSIVHELYIEENIFGEYERVYN